MKAFIGAMLLVALAAQSVQSADFTPEQVDACLQQAEKNAEKIWVLPKLDEICVAKSGRSLKNEELPLFFNECKHVSERVHFAIIETDCEYDLEKLIIAGKAKPLEKLAKVVGIQDYCQEMKKVKGIYGSFLMGESRWFSDLLNLTTGSNLQRK